MQSELVVLFSELKLILSAIPFISIISTTLVVSLFTIAISKFHGGD